MSFSLTLCLLPNAIKEMGTKLLRRKSGSKYLNNILPTLRLGCWWICIKTLNACNPRPPSEARGGEVTVRKRGELDFKFCRYIEANGNLGAGCSPMNRKFYFFCFHTLSMKNGPPPNRKTGR